MPGFISVARSMLALGHLWGEVRVKGGAYGSGAIARSSGLFGYYSYRDPSPYRTIECYKDCGKYLRGMAESDEDFTGFIIGAVGESDTLITPKNRGFISLAIYLRGESYEARCKKREEMLGTSKEDLLIAARIAEAATEAGFCIVGSRDILEKEKSKLSHLFEI
jgi:Zn-dependent M16 (insulinase) family peptidase